MEVRALACVAGAILINLTLGTFYSIGNVVPYVASYMQNHGSPNVSSEDGTWITAAFLLGQGMFLIVGSCIEQASNSRFACIFGCLIHVASTFLTMLAIDINIFVVIILYGLGCGMGCGSSYIASIIAAQKWFPNRKGLFTGMIVAGFGFGGLIFTFLQTMYMNPDNLAPDSNGYFPQSVYRRTPNLFLYMGIIFSIVQSLGCLLAFPPPTEQAESPADGPTNKNVIIVEEFLPNMTSVSSAFKYRIFYVIGFMMMAVAPGVTFVNSLGKRYGQVYIQDDNFLATVVAVAAVANASGRLTWGYLTDKFSFSTCYIIKVILFAAMISAFPFAFILESKVLYMIWMLGLFFGFSGTFVLFPVYIEQVFGSKYHGMVYGILYTALATSSIITSLIIKTCINIQSSTSARVMPCIIIAIAYLASLLVYRLAVPVEKIENSIKKRREFNTNMAKQSLSDRKDLNPIDKIQKEQSLGSIVRFTDQPP